jgi:hypothetical protein
MPLSYLGKFNSEEVGVRLRLHVVIAVLHNMATLF